jgi:hypothetical protein
VLIRNETPAYPSGDEVQAIERWEPPEAMTDMTPDIIKAVLIDIEKGLPDGQLYSATPSATTRAAWRVIIVSHVPQKSERAARDLISQWIREGILRSEKDEYNSKKKGEDVFGLRVDWEKVPK